MKIRFDITPVAKQGAMFFARNGRVMSYAKPKAHAYEKDIRTLAIAYNAREKFYSEKPLVVRNLIFVFPFPKSARKKDLELGIIPKATMPDTDNLEKALWDGLEGVFFKNDSQICRKCDVVKIYGEKPGIYLELDEWDDDDTQQVLSVLNEFKGE